jgi:hypothetical protein
MAASVAPSTFELLEWVAGRPRSYSEAMEAWGSWCPRHSAWEDALAERLIRVSEGRVFLTNSGREALRITAA